MYLFTVGNSCGKEGACQKSSCCYISKVSFKITVIEKNSKPFHYNAGVVFVSSILFCVSKKSKKSETVNKVRLVC